MRSSRFGFVAILVLSALLASGCGSKNELAVPPPPKVTVARPVMRPVADAIEFRGKAEATATVDLRARVNGYLEKIKFADGANVTAGEELFIIEQAPYQVALDSAKAALQKAEAELQLADSQYKRMAPLVSQRAITQDELDIQAAQVETAKANVAAATAEVRQAELQLEYTVIRAPISGHIGRHLVDVGNLVQAQTTQLAVIDSIDPIYAVFDVSERDVLRFSDMIRQHELPNPTETPPELTLRLENEQGFTHVGRLAFRDPRVDPGTATAYRRGTFPNPDQKILPGMSVDIRAQIGNPIPRLMVEERAIGADQRGTFLLVVNDKNVVEYRPVRLGITSTGMRVIEEGVTENDWVIVNGLQRARPGAEVTPEQTEMAAGSSEGAPVDEKAQPPATGEQAPASPRAEPVKDTPKEEPSASAEG